MTRFPLVMLGGAGLLLVVTIGKQVRDDMSVDIAPKPPVSGPVAARPAQAPEAVDPRIADWVAVAAARPLFSRDRRPAGEATVPSADTKAGDAKAGGKLRLAGIVVTPFGRSAIFAVSGSAKPVVLEEGLKLGDITVREITVDHVVVDGPQGAQTMVPSFGVPSLGVPSLGPPGTSPMSDGAAAPERPEASPPPLPPGMRSRGERVAPRGGAAFGAPLQGAAP